MSITVGFHAYDDGRTRVLNLRPIFEDGIDVLSRHAEFLKVPPLPATVYLLQRDVINHYRYAATHYLSLTLTEHYLQNSSLGTPYEKWAKFTNDDFETLSFSLTNLIRYTTRLIHETEAIAFRAQQRHREANARSNQYIPPLVEINHRNRQVGLRVNSDETVSVTPFATDTDYEGKVGGRTAANGTFHYIHVTCDAEGNEVERIITTAEWQQLTRRLRERRIELGDRSVLLQLKADALSESEELERLNDEFGVICNSYYSQGDVAVSFDNLHEEWCL